MRRRHRTYRVAIGSRWAAVWRDQLMAVRKFAPAEPAASITDASPALAHARAMTTRVKDTERPTEPRLSRNRPPLATAAGPRKADAAAGKRGGRRYGMDTFAVYRSNWCSVPSGLSPVLFELSDQAGQNVPDTNA